ncbi:MAG: hypothetical protein M3N47_06180, partial [Chloroflexota bacterium]|nr:hypothetical protein [Chloroflexota bacterium]
MKQRPIGGVVERRDVVAQRVDQDVHDLRGVIRHPYAPAPALRRPRDAEVLQSLPDKREHLGLAVLGLDAKSVAGDQVVQLPLVARQPKEIVLLVHLLRHDAVDRTAPLDQLVRPVEALVADAVASGVVALVDVTGGDAGAPQPLSVGHQPRVLSRANEVIPRQRQRFTQAGKAGGVALD